MTFETSFKNDFDGGIRATDAVRQRDHMVPADFTGHSTGYNAR
jgi:hypothetical protein